MRFCTASRTSPYLVHSVLTAPSRVETSPERFWMARVRKPICRLFRMDHRVVGPAMTTRQSRWMLSARPGRRMTSAKRPSMGRKRMPKSVLTGRLTYLSRMSRAQALTRVSSCLPAASDALGVRPLLGVEEALVVFHRELGVDGQEHGGLAVLAGQLYGELDALGAVAVGEAVSCFEVSKEF